MSEFFEEAGAVELFGGEGSAKGGIREGVGQDLFPVDPVFDGVPLEAELAGVPLAGWETGIAGGREIVIESAGLVGRVIGTGGAGPVHQLEFKAEGGFVQQRAMGIAQLVRGLGLEEILDAGVGAGFNEPFEGEEEGFEGQQGPEITLAAGSRAAAEFAVGEEPTVIGRSGLGGRAEVAEVIAGKEIESLGRRGRGEGVQWACQGSQTGQARQSGQCRQSRQAEEEPAAG